MSKTHELATQLGLRLKQVGDDWLNSILFVNATENSLTVSVLTVFARNWVRTKYSDLIANAWFELTGDKVEVEVVLRDATRRQPVADDGVLVDPKRAHFRKIFRDRELSQNRDEKASQLHTRRAAPKPKSATIQKNKNRVAQITAYKQLDSVMRRNAEAIIAVVREFYGLEDDAYLRKKKADEQEKKAKIMALYLILSNVGKGYSTAVGIMFGLTSSTINGYLHRVTHRKSLHTHFFTDFRDLRQTLAREMGFTPISEE